MDFSLMDEEGRRDGWKRREEERRREEETERKTERRDGDYNRGMQGVNWLRFPSRQTTNKQKKNAKERKRK